MKTQKIETIYNRVSTDLDLPLVCRTQANMWKMKFYEMREEVVKANKGIKRLRRKVDKMEKNTLQHIFIMGKMGKISLNIREVLGFIVLGIDNGNVGAARNLAQDYLDSLEVVETREEVSPPDTQDAIG